MEQYDLFGLCGDYCEAFGQYNKLIKQTAKQMSEFEDLYGFESRLECISYHSGDF